MFDVVKISLIAYMFVYLGQPEYIFCWYQKLIDRLPDWLWKPLGGCYKCFAGQCMFWYYIIFLTGEGYDFFEHLFYVSAAIVLASIYDKLMTYLDE